MEEADRFILGTQHQIRIMFRDIRWLKSCRQQFIALSAEQMAFYEDVGEVRPKLLQCLPFNQTSELERLQCFDLSPLSDEALALGYVNGKIVITKAAAEPDIRNLNNAVELVCDLAKPVNFLNFSSVTDAYLAACLEGGRSQDYSVCVYDISNPKLHVFCVNCNERVMDLTWLTHDPSMLCLGCSRSIKFFDIREGSRPVCSVAVSNQVRSISASDAHLCIACIIDDFACIYDRRHLTSPLYKMQVSYFKKNDAGAVKILWNPHSSTCLSCFRRNSRVVTELISPSENILDESMAEVPGFPMSDAIDLVQSGFRGARYLEDIGSMKLTHPYLELNYKFFGISRVSGFSWHPENRDRLLVVAPDGGRGAFEVRLATVNKFVTGDYSSEGFLVHASGNQLYVRSTDPVTIDESADISLIMKSRAAKNFGSPQSTTLGGYIRSCKEIIDCCPYSTPEMKWLWKWIQHMISIVDWKPCVYGTLFPGIMDIMQHSMDPDKEELTTERIFLFDPFLGRIRLYRGKERDRVLRICGWPVLGDIIQLDAFIDENVMERKTQSRAVAAALISANSARMKKALNLMLDKARESNDKELLEIEAFQEALQHYRGVPEQWKSFSDSLRSIVKDPYFNMIITFLDFRCDSFSDLQCIVHQQNIPLEDRIAFAAIHFNDQYFMKLMRELIMDSCLCRTLSGLLIIGISYEKATHDLLSQYVDYTGDIQTATVLLVVGRCFTKEQSWPVTYSAEEVAGSDFELLVAEDNESCLELNEYMRRSCIIVCDYLDMLNTWGMWVQRARLDCILGWRRDAVLFESKMNQSTVQAEICCQFCPQNITLDKSDVSSASVSSTMLVPTTRLNISSTSSAAPSIPAREMACSHCLKPLPKCILCRRHMGSYVQTECHELGRLSSWFTWCQKCRHGGHMAHLWHWFNGHAECAASGCLCNCKIEDSDIVGLNVELPQTCLFCEDSC
uniref:GATOR complex protein MIO zinc-ribbon like domain-containing protein n=1 Tax=Setaria digitata TaxID=48799 RepID=A0A915PK25_9BILA